jgi:uncharacterized damage-inducible protein DinB
MKQQFLEAYDREHLSTMRVLRNYPADKSEMRPHPKLRTARELAFVFALESYLGERVWNDEIAKKGLSGKPPQPPETWDEVLDAIEKGAKQFRDVIAAAPEEALDEKVTFMSGPKTMGHTPRIAFLWFLLSDQIHHRGQFSIYLRLADAKVPAIYGPSGDEPWT